MKQTSSKTQLILSILIGVALIGYAVYAYFDITAWEKNGGSYKMPRMLMFVYELVGVWGVSTVITALGGYLIYNGLTKLKQVDNSQTRD